MASPSGPGSPLRRRRASQSWIAATVAIMTRELTRLTVIPSRTYSSETVIVTSTTMTPTSTSNGWNRRVMLPISSGMTNVSAGNTA